MDNFEKIFAQINNAILDIQSSQLQTYERPLKNLSRILHDPSLEEINRKLIEGVDYEAFIKESEKTGGSMVGSQRLVWPEDPEQVLGLTLLIIDKIASDSDFAFNFSHAYFYSGNSVVAWIHLLNRQMLIPFVRDYKEFVMSHRGAVGTGNQERVKIVSNKIFIVHGHDEAARESVARFLTVAGLNPVILHEQASRGRTVIEKIEENSDVDFAIVLITPDDEGREKGKEEFVPRARQNVLLELGYFIGKLGRRNVCALKRGSVEIPSDFLGVVWAEMDSGNGWRLTVGRELVAAGHEINWNAVAGI